VDARSLGLEEKQFGHRCSACNGSGSLTLDTSFLPAAHVPCEVCRGSMAEPRAAHALPELRAPCEALL